MEYKEITHKSLNGGKKTRVYYTVHPKEFDLFFYEIYQENHYKKGLDYIKKIKDPVVVDLGANVGLATLYFAPFAKKVYSFEPSPPVFEALKKNTSKLKNVEVFNEGALAVSESIQMFSPNDLTPPQAIWDGLSDYVQLVEAKFFNIKELFERHGITHVDLLKIDIESYELEVFPSPAFGEVSKNIDAIVGEGHVVKLPNGGVSTIPGFIPIILEEWGYKTEFIKTKKPYFQWTYNFGIGDLKKNYNIDIDAIFFAQKTTS